MDGLCKYKNALGEPKKGIHSYRFLGMAIMDVIMTIIGAFLISYFSGVHFVYTVVGLFLLGIVLHRMFCVDTTIDRVVKKYLF